MTHNTFILGESRTCSRVAWRFSVRYMRALGLLILPLTSKVTSSLHTSWSSNPSSSNFIISIHGELVYQCSSTVGPTVAFMESYAIVSLKNAKQLLMETKIFYWLFRLISEGSVGRHFKLVKPYHLKLRSVPFFYRGTNTFPPFLEFWKPIQNRTLVL